MVLLIFTYLGAVKTDHKQLFEAIGAPNRRTTEMIPEKDEFLLDDVMDEECRVRCVDI